MFSASSVLLLESPLRLFSPGDDLVHGFIRDQQGDITIFVLPKGAVPTSINARGDITGHSAPYWEGSSGDGFLRDPKGVITEFDVPGRSGCGGGGAQPASINNAGDVAGWYCSEEQCQCHGFIRKRDGSFTTFDASLNASGNSTRIFGINEKRDVVGAFSDAIGNHQFLRDHEGNITVFDFPNGFSGGTSTCINNRDDVTGVIRGNDGITHGFVRQH